MIRFFVLAAAVSSLAISDACPPTFKFPTAALNPASVTFSPQVLSVSGTGTPQAVVLSAGGQANLKITAIVSSGDFSQTNDCPMSPNTMAPGTSCTLQVSFAPNVIGDIKGAITINDNVIGGPTLLPLSGTALPPVGFSPASLDFGTVAVNSSSASQTVTMANNESTSLAISAIAASGNYAQTNNCPASLAAGQSCTINVTFHPTNVGAVPGALTVSSDASPGTQPVGLTGSGSGSASSGVHLSAASLAFGDVEAGATSAAKTVTVTNSGGSALSVQGISTSGGYESSNDCGASISAGASCTITVQFQPSADFANVAYPGAITLTDSDASSPHVVGLSGTGVQPVTASPAAVDFGTLDPTSSNVDQSITITNNHSAAEDLSITPSGHFGVTSNNCTQAVPPGAQCTATVAFTSTTQAGPQTGTMTITPSSTGFLTPTVVSLSACATPLAVTPHSFNFGAVAAGATSTEQTTISNSSAVVNISGISITGTDASDFAISNNTCSTTLDDGASCTLDIDYAPKSSGARSATLTVSDDAACSPQQTPLKGGSSAGPFILFVTTNEVTASGTVTSSPPGINCGGGLTDCAASFPTGTTVTLTPTPASAFQLAWSGACSGIGACAVTMNADQQVSATINRNPETILMITGTGGGSVTSNPPGIVCSVPFVEADNCVADFPVGATVSLTPAADSTSVFAGWSGGSCSGTGTCSFTSSSDQTITATFTSTAPDFTMSASTPAPAAVAAGTSATSSVTLTSVNAFNSAVNLTCSVQPTPESAPTCSLNPASPTPAANGSVKSTLTINTIAPHEAAMRSAAVFALWLPIGGLAWAGVGGPRRSRKKVVLALLCLVVLTGFLVQMACGGGGSRTHVLTGGTPAGTYTVTVTGTSGSSNQHSATVMLTVD